jgi:hypothetical protein
VVYKSQHGTAAHLRFHINKFKSFEHWRCRGRNWTERFLPLTDTFLDIIQLKPGQKISNIFDPISREITCFRYVFRPIRSENCDQEFACIAERLSQEISWSSDAFARAPAPCCDRYGMNRATKDSGQSLLLVLGISPGFRGMLDVLNSFRLLNAGI